MPDKKTASSSSSHFKQSRSARELWLQAVQNGTGTLNMTNRRGVTNPKKTPTELWINSLRKSKGLSSDIKSMDTFGSSRKPHDDAVPYLSTSHYLRERVGSEKKRPTTADSSGRAAPGTPAYKTPEEYYDEVLELRKHISDVTKESGTLKARLRRVEEDNLKKEKEMEQLLDPSKSAAIRRTLGDRKPDAGAVVQSMKQKVLRLEQQLKEREVEMSKLRSDSKVTKMDEAKLQLEICFQEITRLQSLPRGARGQEGPTQAKTGKEPKESSSKVKALNDTILRMNEKNHRLTTENKSLKDDLEKLMSKLTLQKEIQKEYEDMSKNQLMGAISKLEMKLEKHEVTETKAEAKDKDKGLNSTEEKITLTGTLAQRLDQLDSRETELLEELKKVRVTLKKVKEDRTHYRKKHDDKLKEVEILKLDIVDLATDLDLLQRKSSENPSKLENPAKRSRPKISLAQRQKELRDFKENRAAKTIQRGWRKHRDDDREDERGLRRNQLRKPAARYRDDEFGSEDDLMDAPQPVARNRRQPLERQRSRSRSISRSRESLVEQEESYSRTQPKPRERNTRKTFLNEDSFAESPRGSRPSSARSSSSLKKRHSKQLDSEGEDISEEILTPRSLRSTPPRSRRTPTPIHVDTDDDDDIMF